MFNACKLQKYFKLQIEMLTLGAKKRAARFIFFKTQLSFFVCNLFQILFFVNITNCIKLKLQAIPGASVFLPNLGCLCKNKQTKTVKDHLYFENEDLSAKSN